MPHLEPRQRATLVWSMLGSSLMIFAAYSGVMTVLLPARVEALGPAEKAANLAVVLSIPALIAMFAQPLAGAFSDRSRSRFGRRSPFIFAGVAGGGALLLALALAQSVALLALFWALAYFLIAGGQGLMSTALAERIEPNYRARASAFLGVGVSLGSSLGVFMTGLLVQRPEVGFVILGVAVILGAGAFVALNRERSAVDRPVAPLHLGRLAKSFWVNPLVHKNFAWVFVGRLVVFTGQQVVTAYLFYILIDYLAMTPVEAGRWVGQLSLTTMVLMTATIVFVGRLSDRIGRRKVFLIASRLTVAVALLTPLLWPSLVGMLVYSALVGLGAGMTIAVDLALVIEVLPSQADMGKDLGILNIAYSIPMATSPVIGAALLGAGGSNYPLLFVFAAGAALLSVLCVLPLKSVS